jgi:hypothetical protein
MASTGDDELHPTIRPLQFNDTGDVIGRTPGTKSAKVFLATAIASFQH